MKNRRIFILILVAGVLAGVSFAIFNVVRPFILRPFSADGRIQLTEVVSGLSRPLYVTHAGDESERLFVVEQDGFIRIVENGVVRAEAFLDVSALVNRDGSERGLLGLAFHPSYANNGQFFVNYTALSGNNVVARYQVSGDDLNRADPVSAQVLLSLEDPYPNHNAGQLAFGPDGYLYVGTGDGGSAGDPLGNAQNPGVLLGKMLRLDVDAGEPYAVPPDNPFAQGAAFAPEIWAWGLRNPWRYSFDRATGDLYIADVGQNEWEEINFQPASSLGGENYGWNILEGTRPFSGAAVPEGTVMPIAEYNHSEGCSVTGGYVYRGARMPDLQGHYIYGDFCSGTIWTTRRNDAQWHTERLMNSGRVISSFGEDETGELYLVDYGGSLLRFEPV